MLRYFIAVTQGLVSTAILMGILYAYIQMSYGIRGRNILMAGSVAGFVAAVVMAIVKNQTNLIHTSIWNLRIFTVSILAFLLFFILSLEPIKKRWKSRAELVLSILSAVLAFTFFLYALPDVMAYPFTSFLFNGETVFSTAFLYRFIGWMLGFLFMIVVCLTIGWLTGRTEPVIARRILHLVLLINALQQGSKMIQIMLARRILSGSGLFAIARYTSNYSDAFIYAELIAAVILPIRLIMAGFHVKEPYENPAQHRKIRAKWRDIRRWSGSAVACFILCVVTLTWLTAIQNRAVELSPVEDSELRGDSVYVSLEQVDDGHLHRFAYTTPNHVTVRFIVIKKPNSSSYGIGLDACDICGETGYFERGDQIVCKLCDVVMNVNTIGFKGGCNPIVIDYHIENGYIIVPTDTLVEHENEFK